MLELFLKKVFFRFLVLQSTLLLVLDAEMDMGTVLILELADLHLDRTNSGPRALEVLPGLEHSGTSKKKLLVL